MVTIYSSRVEHFLFNKFLISTFVACTYCLHDLCVTVWTCTMIYLMLLHIRNNVVTHTILITYQCCYIAVLLLPLCTIVVTHTNVVLWCHIPMLFKHTETFLTSFLYLFWTQTYFILILYHICLCFLISFLDHSMSETPHKPLQPEVSGNVVAFQNPAFAEVDLWWIVWPGSLPWDQNNPSTLLFGLCWKLLSELYSCIFLPFFFYNFLNFRFEFLVFLDFFYWCTMNQRR